MLDIQPFIKIFDKLCYRHSDRTVFDHFLTMCLCAASLQKYEEEYLEVVKQYSKEEVNLFCELFAQLIILSDGDGTGKVDILGEFYMERLSHGHNGEFYTPQHVCDFIASCTVEGVRFLRSFQDPACGSGRTMMAAAKIAGMHNTFFCFDVSGTAVKMCALNMWMNGLRSFIVHGDSLALKAYGGYRVEFHFTEKGMYPQISKLTAEEAQSCMGTFKEKPKELPLGPPELVEHKQAIEQLSLFQ